MAVLTVPAGHKYEVLEIGYWGTSGGGGINVVELVTDGTTLVLPNARTYAAGLFADTILHNALCLEAGDVYSVASNNTTGGITYWVTFMDVDFA